MQFVVASLHGLAIGMIAAITCQCGLAWWHGESADPRCVQRWRGYVEVHYLTNSADRMQCEYRPEITGAQR
jgi:hypothetical protein